MKKIIPVRYFNELKNEGHTVPRFESTGKVMPFTVGKTYTMQSTSKSDNETVKAKCTQNCPYALVRI